VGCLSHNSQISDPLLVRKRENYGRDILFRRSQTQIESADTHPSKASRQSKNFARHRLLARGAAAGGTQDPVGAGLLSSVDPHRTSIMVREGSDPAGEDGLQGVVRDPLAVEINESRIGPDSGENLIESVVQRRDPRDEPVRRPNESSLAVTAKR
jgi:hypothetical protein